MLAAPASLARTWVHRALRAVTDVLFPPTCVTCGTPGVDDGEPVCRECRARMDREWPVNYCPTCGRTVPPFVMVDGRCNQCRAQKTSIAGITRVGPYNPVLCFFKRQEHVQLACMIATRLAVLMRECSWFDSVEALVTVPPWWLRERMGRYYAPHVLTRRVSLTTGIPLLPALRRIRGGPSQVGLTAAQRIQNVHGKFAMVRGVRLHGATLCLVDDVMTTGATLEECAKVLRRAGAKAVYAAVAAHVSPGTPSVTPSA